MPAPLPVPSTTDRAPGAGPDDAGGSVRQGWPRRIPRLGLRARVTLAFAVGALLLSMAMSLLVIGVARSNLVSQRESSATSVRIFASP